MRRDGSETERRMGDDERMRGGGRGRGRRFKLD